MWVILQGLACKFPIMLLLVFSGAVAVWICMRACRCCKIRVGLAVLGLWLAFGGIHRGLVNVVVIIVVVVCLRRGALTARGWQ